MNINLDDDTVRDFLALKEERDALTASQCGSLDEYLYKAPVLNQQYLRMADIIAAAVKLQSEFGRVA